MPFTLTNLKQDLEDLGSNFDGPPDLEFRHASKALGLEHCGLSYQRASRPTTGSRTATLTRRRKRCTWSCAGAGG